MANYKRSKPREKKTVELGTPKEYLVKGEVEMPVAEDATGGITVPITEGKKVKKRKKIQCKILKGDHDFIRTGAEPIRWLGGKQTVYYLRCRGCMKQKIDIVTDELQEKEEQKTSKMHIVH